jgi:hypothetical protein
MLSSQAPKAVAAQLHQAFAEILRKALSDPALIPYAKNYGYPHYLQSCQALGQEPEQKFKHFAASPEELLEKLSTDSEYPAKYTDADAWKDLRINGYIHGQNPEFRLTGKGLERLGKYLRENNL